MRTATRLQVGVTTTIHEFVRQPVNFALLFVLPPLIIPAYGTIMSAFPQLPYMEMAPATLGAKAGTLYVAAFLPGVIGLFQVISARRADERLLLTGYPRPILFGARLTTVALATLLTAAIATTVLTTRITITAPAPGFLVLVLVGMMYGLIGMLIGAILPRELEGSLVLIFLADFDEALASGLVLPDATITKLFPLYYPNRLFDAAVTGTTMARGDLLAVTAYLAGLGLLTGVVYQFVTTGGHTHD